VSLRHALLGALADRPRTGYALLKHFEQSLGYAWPASHGQIYPELARLRDDGLIEQTASGARGSRTYAVTEAGLEETRRWLLETEPDRRVRNDAALRTFFLWLLEPEEARDHLERERAYWQGVLSELEAIREEPAGTSRKERAFWLALEGGVLSVSARLEWIEWALGEVSSSSWRRT
jgi:PadR family transcriptional regulator, regulatory protein AphA